MIDSLVVLKNVPEQISILPLRKHSFCDAARLDLGVELTAKLARSSSWLDSFTLLFVWRFLYLLQHQKT